MSGSSGIKVTKQPAQAADLHLPCEIRTCTQLAAVRGRGPGPWSLPPLTGSCVWQGHKNHAVGGHACIQAKQ